MGDKPTWKRQHLLRYLAGCLMGGVLLVGCATGLLNREDRDLSMTAARHLTLGECELLQGDYASARRECETVLRQFPGRQEDQALTLLGMVWVHPDNPRQDTHQAAICFRRVVDNYPNSPWVAACQTWLDVIARLEEKDSLIERLETGSAALEQQLKVEKGKRARLEERLQQMKAIDLTVE